MRKKKAPFDFSKVGLFTPLWGEEQIRGFLQFHPKKFYERLPQMKKEGTVFFQRTGKPPRKMLKSFPILLLRYQMREGAKGRIL